MRYQSFFVALVSKDLQLIFQFADFDIPFVLVTTLYPSDMLIRMGIVHNLCPKLSKTQIWPFWTTFLSASRAQARASSKGVGEAEAEAEVRVRIYSIQRF